MRPPRSSPDQTGAGDTSTSKETAERKNFSDKTIQDLKQFMWIQASWGKDPHKAATKEWRREFVRLHPEMTPAQLEQALTNYKRRWLPGRIQEEQRKRGLAFKHLCDIAEVLVEDPEADPAKVLAKWIYINAVFYFFLSML